jgi:hypothetical protein
MKAMNSLWIKQLVWPPWAERCRRDIAWGICIRAVHHLAMKQSYDHNDLEAAKLINRIAKELS